MFSTSSLYFLVAIFGESIESSKAHGLQLVEGRMKLPSLVTMRNKRKHTKFTMNLVNHLNNTYKENRQ
ncbi:MAG: hypothetical protein E6K97_01865 [Thaumarchaeota archaeon]|nr:MAG: hypothetical protein E6K97_01865 [Nitrososphaerota archaeon]